MNNLIKLAHVKQIPILFLLMSLVNIAKQEVPRVSIKAWKSVENLRNDNWVNDTREIPLGPGSNSSTYVVPSAIRGLTIVCNATYPVSWDFSRVKWGRKTSWDTNLVVLRGSDPVSLKPAWFAVEITLFGSNTGLTGSYSCVKYADKSVSTSVYVYWEGSSPPYLTHLSSGKDTRTIYFDKATAKPITIPCTVSRPDITVSLTKWNHDKTTSVTLELNEYITYDPTKGFILTKQDEPHGFYKCQVGDEEDQDTFTFELQEGSNTPEPEFEDKIWKTSSFTYDKVNHQFSCCSSSSKPPKIVHYYCLNPIICQHQKHALHEIEKPSRRMVKQNCSVVKLYIYSAGVLRCKGDDIDIVREYFFPDFFRIHASAKMVTNVKLPNQTASAENFQTPYYTWGEAVIDDMIHINNSNVTMYIGQILKFHCKANPFYFAEGIHWGLVYKNQTLNVYGTIKQHHHMFGLRYAKTSVELELNIEEDLLEIICKAPVWNTTEWGNKTIKVSKKKPILASILNSNEREHYQWYVNETMKEIKCQFTGDPVPNVIWMKDNKTLQRNYSVSNSQTSITFSKVHMEHHGTYTCVVSNFAGNGSKTFVIEVVVGLSNGTIAMYVVLAICITFGIIGGLISIKKIKSQRAAIQKLANVAFKDVSDSPSAKQNNQPDFFGEYERNIVYNGAMPSSSVDEGPGIRTPGTNIGQYVKM